MWGTLSSPSEIVTLTGRLVIEPRAVVSSTVYVYARKQTGKQTKQKNNERVITQNSGENSHSMNCTKRTLKCLSLKQKIQVWDTKCCFFWLYRTVSWGNHCTELCSFEMQQYIEIMSPLLTQNNRKSPPVSARKVLLQVLQEVWLTCSGSSFVKTEERCREISDYTVR